MRALLLMLIALVPPVGFSAQAASPLTAAVLATDAASAGPSAVWEHRKLRNFTLPLVVNSENGPLQEASCDQLYNTVKILLVQFGARANDIHADMRNCYAYTLNRSIDVWFSALTPTDKLGVNASGPLVAARWQTVQLNGNCRLLQQATTTILPLFTTRNVKLIPPADCARLGVGLFAQVLKAPEAQVSAP